MSFAGAALKGHVVDLADEIDHDLVAIGGLVALLGILIAGLRLGELLQLVLDRLFVDFDCQPLELEAIDLGRRNVRKRFEPDIDLGVLAGFVTFVELDLGLHGRAKLLVGQELLDAVLHRRVERIAHQRFAVHLADEIRRHLAGAEARHAHGRRDALDLSVDAGVDILGWDDQLVGPLQAFVLRLDGLHHLRIPNSN